MISTDKGLFEDGAPVRARLLEQSELVSSIDVVVLTPKGERFKKTKLGKRLTLHPTASTGRFAYLSDAYNISKEILRTEVEGKWLITTQDPFFIGALGYILSRQFHTPLHLQLHTDPSNLIWKTARLRNRFEVLIARFLLTHADGVRVVSERVRHFVLALGVSPEKITVVPIWVDVKKFEKGVAQFDLHRSYPSFSRIILSMGRLEPEKNYFKLIKVFAQILKAHDDTMLLIVGSGSERERLTILVRSLGIENAVVLLPWARDVVSYYKTSDIYVQPSFYEGWGMAVIEAMSAGLPVVMTDVGCAGEIVRNEETGLVVPVGDEEMLHLALRRLLEDNQLRVTLGLSGQEEVKKLATKEETMRLYKESWQKAYGKTAEKVVSVTKKKTTKPRVHEERTK